MGFWHALGWGGDGQISFVPRPIDSRKAGWRKGRTGFLRCSIGLTGAVVSQAGGSCRERVRGLAITLELGRFVDSLLEVDELLFIHDAGWGWGVGGRAGFGWGVGGGNVPHVSTI